MRSIRKWFQGINQKDTEHGLYWLSFIILPVVAAVYFLIYMIADITGAKSMTQCMLKTLTGIPCPGCGGTRALVCLFHGKVISGIYYNAFAIYCVVVYAVFMISQTLQRLSRGRVKGMKYRNGYIWTAILILFVQYLMKLFVPGYDV